MMRLALQIFSDYTKTTLLASFSARASGLGFGTNEHGFESLTFSVPMPVREAFYWYDLRGLPHVVLSGLGLTVWEGRLESVALTDSGVAFTALGYWRAYSDFPVTFLWSDSSVARWRQLTISDNSTYISDRFEADNNNRLYVAPTKSATYGNAPFVIGSWGYQIPAPSPYGSRLIQTVSFNYTVLLPTSWIAQVVARSANWATGVVVWTLSGTGATQTGTASVTLPGVGVNNPNDRLSFDVYYNAAAAVYSAETGAFYALLSNLRVGTRASGLNSDVLCWALENVVAGVNPGQINAGDAPGRSTAPPQVQATGTDVYDGVYEDAYPADIMTKVAQLGDNQTPPRPWEVGVYEDRRLFFRPRFSAGRTWYVDAQTLTINRDLDTLRNAAYTVYQDATGQGQRTSKNANAASIQKYGIERAAPLTAQTTSPTFATTQRDVYVADNATVIPKASVTFDRVFDATGGQYPLWMVRTGDTIIVRNLPAGISATVDRIRSFHLIATHYDVDTGVLQVTPEEHLDTLTWMLARRDARLRVSPVGLAAQ